ncbi:MAG: carbon-nitrogen hydrolase family protein [Gemmatimonadota bacterium]
MLNRIRIAQIKVYPIKADLDANFESLLRLLDGLAAARPDVVVTPEGFLDGYAATEPRISAASLGRLAVDPAASPYVDVAASWAADARSWLVLGCARRVGRRAANSALVLDRSGRLVGAYDKTHLQAHDRKYVAGQALPVFASDFGPFGVLICADRRWPETVRTLALRGARVIFNPTYGMHDQRNRQMMQTRSYESEVAIAFTHPGQSLVTGPAGEVLTDRRGPSPRWVLTEVDLSAVDRRRAGSSHLRDRRPELYA